MMYKAWCCIEGVPYHFSMSSIKFQGHTGRKIDNLNTIWVRLLGRRSQLSTPSDLPYLSLNIMANISQTTFQVHFDEWNFFDLNFTEVCPYGSNWQFGSTGSGNGLAPNRPQTITWTKADLGHRIGGKPLPKSMLNVNWLITFGVCADDSQIQSSWRLFFPCQRSNWSFILKLCECRYGRLYEQNFVNIEQFYQSAMH